MRIRIGEYISLNQEWKTAKFPFESVCGDLKETPCSFQPTETLRKLDGNTLNVSDKTETLRKRQTLPPFFSYTFPVVTDLRKRNGNVNFSELRKRLVKNLKTVLDHQIKGLKLIWL